MAHTDNDFVPVTGGVDLAGDYVRDDLDSLCDVQVQSDLDRLLLRLLALHKDVRVRFGGRDLVSMSAADKQSLLQDMNDLLGIEPLQTAIR